MSYSTLNRAQLEAEGVRDVFFVFLDFAGDPIHACTGTRSYVWNSATWLGIGEVAGISDIATASDIAARPLTLTLSGVDSYLVQPALSRTNYKGRQATVYRGFLDADESLIDDPDAVWSGRMDVCQVTVDSGVATVQLRCEPLASRLLRPNISRYSDQDHQGRWPGDLFFQYLPQMADKDVVWGGRRISPGYVGGGGGGGGGLPPIFNPYSPDPYDWTDDLTPDVQNR